MTPKELVLNAIHFRPVPRTPVSVLDGYNNMLRRHNMTQAKLFSMDAEESADFIIREYELMDSDMVYANAFANTALREVMSGGDASRPALEKPSDICGFNADNVFEKTANHPTFEYFGRQLEALNRKIGDEKLILAFGTGPLTNAAGMLGMEKLMMALHEEPEEIKPLLNFAVDITIKMLEYQVMHGATAISVADPVSSVNLISETFFEKYSLPGIKKINMAVKKFNIPIMLHICGDTTSRLEPLIGSGIDIFSLDSVDLKTAFEKSKCDYAIFGNLSTVDMMLNGTEDEIYKNAKMLCENAETGFILAPGCDLPPDTPIENIQAMVKAAKSRI